MIHSIHVDHAYSVHRKQISVHRSFSKKEVAYHS
jgi:hypothetical protein